MKMKDCDIMKIAVKDKELDKELKEHGMKAFVGV